MSHDEYFASIALSLARQGLRREAMEAVAKIEGVQRRQDVRWEVGLILREVAAAEAAAPAWARQEREEEEWLV